MAHTKGKPAVCVGVQVLLEEASMQQGMWLLCSFQSMAHTNGRPAVCVDVQAV